MTYLRIPDLLRDDHDEDEVEEPVDRDRDRGEDVDRDRDQQGDTNKADDAALPKNRPCRNPIPIPTPTPYPYPILASPATRCSHPRAPSRRCTSLITPPMPAEKNRRFVSMKVKSPESLTTSYPQTPNPIYQ